MKYEVVRVYDEEVVSKGGIFLEKRSEEYTQKELKTKLIKWCVEHHMSSGLYCIKYVGYDVDVMYPEYFNKR